MKDDAGLELVTALSEAAKRTSLSHEISNEDLISAIFGWGIGNLIQFTKMTPEQIGKHAENTARQILELAQSQAESESK